MDMPEPNDGEHIRILALDPGTVTLGSAIIDVDGRNYDFKIIYGHTFDTTQSVKLFDNLPSVRPSRDARLIAHRQNLLELFLQTQPDIIVTETPFARRGKMSAYDALLEFQGMLRCVLYSYCRSMSLKRITPTVAKNALGVSHIKTSKDDVQKAVMSKLSEHVIDGVDLSLFDEHTIDSIAVGYAYYRQSLLGESFSLTKTKRSKKKKANKG